MRRWVGRVCRDGPRPSWRVRVPPDGTGSNSWPSSATHARPSEHSIPVAIAGAGACGMTAALAARDAGVGGAGAGARPAPLGQHLHVDQSDVRGGFCAKHAAHGIEDSAERFVADVMAKTAGLRRSAPHASGGVPFGPGRLI